MIEVRLERLAYTRYATFGVLHIGDLSWFTIERPWQGNATSVSAIPEGTYPLVLEYSPKFKRDLWELKGVPGRAEVKIHAASRAEDLEGCIAPGKYMGVFESRDALEEIMRVLGQREDARIVVTGPGLQPRPPQPVGPLG